MATSDEALAKEREAIEKLRAEVAATEAKRHERERNVSNELEMQQLKTERVRLESQLAAAKAAASASAVKEGSSAQMELLKEEARQAEAARKAAESEEGN